MNTKKGFTLVELLVVIAILAILATVSVVGYTSFIERAEQSNAQTELHQIETTIKSYHISEQPYVIATKTSGDPAVTTKYTVVVANDGTVTLSDGTNTLTDLKGLVWVDFADISADFALGTGNVLTYKGITVDLDD